jgi:hypothetical protein
MLWESWRLTRVEVAWRLALGIAGAWTVLIAFRSFLPARPAVQDFGVALSLILLVVPHIVGWVSLTRLTGGLPGFPFDIHYARPVRTSVLVGVPMIYLTLAAPGIYLVSALFLRVTSGHPFPLYQVAAWIAALNVVHVAVYWSTRNPVVMLLATMPALSGWLLLADHRLNEEEIQGSFDWPPYLWAARFDFPLTDYAVIASIGLAAFAVTVARVARERHGDVRSTPLTLGEFPHQLISLFRFPCPTSSATGAQLWFDFKSSGLPLVTVGVVLAVLNPLIFAVSGYIDAWLSGFYVGGFAVMFAVLSMMVVLFPGLNAFNIRGRRGRLYASSFEAIQACGTFRLAGLKVFSRSVCMLAALLPVVASIWASVRLLAGKGFERLWNWQVGVESAAGAMTGYQQVAVAIVTCIGIAVLVASLAALWALAVRYPRRLNIVAGSLLLLHCLVLLMLAVNGQRGIGLLVDVIRWIELPLLILATLYLYWKALAERLLTLRSALGVVLISAAFAAAWVTVLRAFGMPLAGMPAMDTVSILSPALLPLMASVLAPWSLSRVRHV